MSKLVLRTLESAFAKTSFWGCLFAGLVSAAAASLSSPSYSILHDTLEPAGGTARSTTYTVDGSLGGLTGLSKAQRTGVAIGLGLGGALTPVGLINTAPVLSPLGNQTVAEGVPVTVSPVAMDPDGPFDSLTFTLGGPAPTGASLDPASGRFTWTPSEAQGPGAFPVTFIVTDSGSPPLSSSQTMTITVTEVNIAPILSSIGPQTVTEGRTLSFQIVAEDRDIPANTLSYRLGTGAPAGATIDANTGVFSWTPTEAQGPSASVFEVIVSDNGNPSLSATQTVTVTVNEDNLPPILGPIADQSVVEGGTLTVTAAAIDLDLPAQPLTFRLAGSPPPGLSIDARSGVLTWTPSEEQGPGLYPIIVEVADGGSPALVAAQTFRVGVLEANSSPEVAPIAAQTVAENNTLRLQVTAVDRDLPANRLLYTLAPGAPAGASLDPNTGAFVWTPSEDQGPGEFAVTVVVSDDSTPPATATRSFTVTVTELNTAPVLDAIGTSTIAEGATLTLAAVASDADRPRNTLAFALSANAPVGASIDPATGVIRWTPTEEQGPSTNAFSISVTDNGTPALTDSRPLTVVVTENNVPPVLADIPDQKIAEGATLRVQAVATDPDRPPNTLTFGLGHDAPVGATIDSTTGVLTWTPTEAQGPGVASITVTVTDNGAPSLSAAKTFKVSVSEVNSPPVIAALENRAIDEASTLAFTVVATDPDLPANKLTFSLEPGAPLGALIDPATGVFMWAANETHGPSTNQFVVRVTDNADPPASATQSFTVVVREVNAAPVLAPLADQTAAEGSTLKFTVRASDTDVPANQLTFSLGPDAPPGASIHPQSGAFSWTPIESQGPSTNRFTVRVTDDGNPSLTATQPVTVVVVEVNQPPALADLPNRTIAVGKTLSLAVSALDPDLPANTLTYRLLGKVPAGAAIDPTTGQFTWTPSAAQGPSSNQFTVTVSDNGTPNLGDTRTFTVVVTSGNSAPVLLPIPDQRVIEGGTLQLTASASDADLPGDTLTFSLDPGAPSNLSIQPNSGVITWTPTAAQVPSTNLITVRVTDSGVPSLSDATAFRVFVRPLSTAPTISKISSQTFPENASPAPIVFELADPDTPAEFLKLTVTSSNERLLPLPNIGLDGAGATRTVTLRPVPDQTGLATIRITVEDNTGGVAGTEFEVRVNPTAPAITQQPGDLAVVQGAEAALSVLAVGTRPLSYQWRFNGASFPAATNATLLLTNVTPALAGVYSVEISNVVGRVFSRDVRLQVDVPFGIASQPASRTALAGQEVTFVVVATGPTALSFQWRFNGQDLPGATNSTLTIRNVETNHAGLYMTVVRSGQETLNSAEATLVVNSAVQILRQPVGVRLAPGGTTSFEVEAAGSPPLRYQWQLNGQDLPGENNPRLALVNVQAPQAGLYTALISNAGGTVASEPARLSLIAPPTLVRPPEDKRVLAGRAVEFGITVSGDEPLHYQWFFNGGEIPGAAQPALTLANVQEASTGRYSVAVTNLAGRIVSAPATLTVLVPLSLQRQPQNQTVQVGANAVFTVEARGAAPLSYQWRRNKTNLSGETQPTLTLRGVQPPAAGLYSVVVTSPAGIAESQEAALAVMEPVTIVTHPKSRSAAIGGAVQFTVAASGTAPLAYQWRRNGTSLVGENAPTLNLANLAAGQAGTYDVVVSNGVGSVASQAAQLNLIQSPRLVAQPSSTNVAPGTTVSFAARLEGDEPLRYQWLLNGTRLAGATNAILSLPNVQVSHAGAYSLVVENPAGAVTSDSAVLSLVLPQVPLANLPELGPTITAADGTFDGGSTRSGSRTLLGLRSLPRVDDARWFAWQAPNGGIATFSTTGSDFDTVLAVFSGTPANLTEMARDDDSGGFLTSELAFNASQGVTYYLRVAGFNGATGRITVNHRLRVTPLRLPVITGHPQSQTVAAGSDIRFEVIAQGTALSYEWFVNGTNLPNQTASMLVVRNVQEANVARYRVRVHSGSGENRTSIDSQTATLQIGRTTRFAQDKFGNLFSTAGTSGSTNATSASAPAGPVLSGSLDSLIFTTSGAGKEQSEPNHGRVAGGASVWVNYQAPDSGSLRISTEGSNFDTVLAVYQASGTNFGSLSLVGSDDNAGADGQTSTVRLEATKGTTYYVAVDGANAAVGIAKLTCAVGSPPVITRQPQGLTVAEGASEALFIQTSSPPATAGLEALPLSYQWFKDGSAVAGANGPALFLLKVTEADTGLYWVVVSNAVGSVTSASARFIVQTPVKFLISPQSQTVNPGGLVILTSLAGGTEPLTYQWTKNGLPLAGQTQPTLVLANFQIEDVAEYRLVGQNAIGSASSDTAAVSMLQSPIITLPPTNQVVALGAAVEFTVEAIGSSPLRYQWQFNGADMAQATNPKLAISSAQLGNQGEYRVAVSNGAGTMISSPAFLVVNAPIRFTALPQSLTVTEGSSAVFSSAATGTGAIRYQWRFNNTDIPGAINPTLIVGSVTIAQAGNYSVVARDSAGAVECPAVTLTVNQPPLITRQPANQLAVAGGTATFRVAARGTEPLRYQWWLDQQPLIGATNTSLTLTQLDPIATGRYSVTVSNMVGVVNSVAASLTFKPILSAPVLALGVFQLELNIPEGKQARVQWSTDLILWTDFYPAPLPSGAALVEDRRVAESPSKFYRILLE